jgi:3-oxoacyl-[acyl-carrier-protein] synthase-1
MTAGASPPAVVVSGLGFVTSIGNDHHSVAESLRTLRHGIEPFEFLPGCDVPIKVAGTIKGFATDSQHYADWRWPERYSISRGMLRSIPPHGVHAFCAVEQLIADAHLTLSDLSAEDTGLFTASAGSPFLQRVALNQMYDSHGEHLAPLGVVRTIAGTLNFNLGAHYHIRGAVCGFVSACASSAHAIGYAHDEIRMGRLTRVLVVGAEDLTADSVLSFHGMRALSRNPDPATASRPFDASRDGFVGTGGATALLLESAESARRRGAPIYAEMLGWGQAADGHSVAISDPEGQGLAAALRRTLHATGINPTEVDYINAHATSTPIGDRSEALALHDVFTRAGAHPTISSTKALTGHGLSMAAVMETAFCALAMKEGFTPGQAHLKTPSAECEGLNIPRATQPRQPKIVLKNSSGFGGSNVVLALRRWHEAVP